MEVLIAYLIGVAWGAYILKVKYNMSLWYALTSWLIVFVHYAIDDNDVPPPPSLQP